MAYELPSRRDVLALLLRTEAKFERLDERGDPHFGFMAHNDADTLRFGLAPEPMPGPLTNTMSTLISLADTLKVNRAMTRLIWQVAPRLIGIALVVHARNGRTLTGLDFAGRAYFLDRSGDDLLATDETNVLTPDVIRALGAILHHLAVEYPDPGYARRRLAWTHKLLTAEDMLPS